MISESLITQSPQCVSVDFGSCSAYELCETYLQLAHLCVGQQVHRALLIAGDNDPEGHRRLSDAFLMMARSAAVPIDFKLALVPSTPPIQAIYREAQQALRAIGLNAWVFDTVFEAQEWLDGRATCGRTAS